MIKKLSGSSTGKSGKNSMRVDRTVLQRDDELHRQHLARIYAEARYQHKIEERDRLEKDRQVKTQELRTERNKRLGTKKGLNVDVYA
jgi:hypothetical protein